MTHLTAEMLKTIDGGKVSAGVLSDMITHLEICEACQDLYEDWYARSDMLRLLDETFDATGFQQSLMRRVNREEAVKAAARFGLRDIAAVFAFLLKSFLPVHPKIEPAVGDEKIN